VPAVARPAAPSALIKAVPSTRPAPAQPAPADDAASPTTTAPTIPAATIPAATTTAGGPAPAPTVEQPAPRRPEAGTRERKRQETRARIIDAAAELFDERGFDAVSVMEIARRAGVVEKTVFNHFPVKEGLVFDADPPIRAALLDTVRRRPAGESVSSAAGSFVVAAVRLLGDPQAAAGVARMARVVRGSRTLQVREREILGELTDALADLLAEETAAEPAGAEGAVAGGGTPARTGRLEPWLAAHAVLGLYAGLLELARDRVLAGVTGPLLAAELDRQGRRGLGLLQFGLAGYAKRR
jgi:AcrR family transcriptional regulator